MHFNNVLVLRKKLEEAMSVVDSFGKDARAINRSIDSIKKILMMTMIQIQVLHLQFLVMARMKNEKFLKDKNE